MSIVKEYEILSRSKDVPLHKTAGRFYFEKLLQHFNEGTLQEEILSLFREITDKQYQKQLFQRFVGIVNLETSGFCNRQCVYCPVSLYHRHDKSLVMDKEVFAKIRQNLEYLEFESSISLNGYNEPLLDSCIVSHIRSLRSSCPKSFIGFNSNGDSLRPKLLDELIRSSLNRLNITLHTTPTESYDDTKSLEKIKRFYRKLDLEVPEIQVVPNQSCVSSLQLDSLNLCVNTMNWAKIGNDRGGEIESLSIQSRIEPCVRVFREVFWIIEGLHICAVMSIMIKQSP
ncbi:radical SAM protein [Helicobacter aurati]|uniref:Radical SAM protein n=1 Tax=Helicobacter aurati TaxID=137778 RepID=A0A3D8IZV7_9HELI|nr:radical SAM protein [Helicobacter aurati]RDU70623.1 radical SAM protein [Helicobacter aurati]